MFGGGGGMNPRKMQQMMEQMGVDFDELDVEEAVLRLADGTELHFDGPDVNKIVAQGQETYQVVGEAEEREGSEPLESGEGDDESGDGVEIPDADVEIVAQRTGASEETAREALEANGGDLAAAVEQLE